jgi:hypothetical protein
VASIENIARGEVEEMGFHGMGDSGEMRGQITIFDEGAGGIALATVHPAPRGTAYNRIGLKGFHNFLSRLAVRKIKWDETSNRGRAEGPQNFMSPSECFGITMISHQSGCAGN